MRGNEFVIENSRIREEENWHFQTMESSINSAGDLYRQMNPAVNPLGVNYYRVAFTIP
jgi:hypothetical protein